MASHDLSNPLQSLAVLLELAFDDLPPDSPALGKLEQSVTATEQLRDLIRGLAAFARGVSPRSRSSRLGDALGASLGVCRRRFERQAITVERDTAAIDGLEVDDSTRTGIAMLAALLGVVRAAQASGQLGLALRLQGREGAPARLTLELQPAREGPADVAGEETLHIDDTDLARCRDALGGGAATVEREGPATLRFEFHPSDGVTVGGAGTAVGGAGTG